MFRSKNKKNRYTPAYPSFAIKVGFKGVCIIRTCFHDDKLSKMLKKLNKNAKGSSIVIHTVDLRLWPTIRFRSNYRTLVPFHLDGVGFSYYNQVLMSS